MFIKLDMYMKSAEIKLQIAVRRERDRRVRKGKQEVNLENSCVSQVICKELQKNYMKSNCTLFIKLLKVEHLKENARTLR